METEAVVDHGSLISAAKIFRSSSGDHKIPGVVEPMKTCCSPS